MLFDSLQYQKDIIAWENNTLKGNGIYRGENLSKYGFKYSIGEYVPITERYSAMLSHMISMRIMNKVL